MRSSARDFQRQRSPHGSTRIQRAASARCHCWPTGDGWWLIRGSCGALANCWRSAARRGGWFAVDAGRRFETATGVNRPQSSVGPTPPGAAPGVRPLPRAAPACPPPPRAFADCLCADEHCQNLPSDVMYSLGWPVFRFHLCKQFARRQQKVIIFPLGPQGGVWEVCGGFAGGLAARCKCPGRGLQGKWCAWVARCVGRLALCTRPPNRAPQSLGTLLLRRLRRAI